VRLLQKPSTTLPPQKRIVIGRWHAAAAQASGGHADRPARVGAPLSQRLGSNGPDAGQPPLPRVDPITEEPTLLATLRCGLLGGPPLNAAGDAMSILDDARLDDKPARKWSRNRSIMRPTAHDLSRTEKLTSLLIGSSRHRDDVALPVELRWRPVPASRSAKLEDSECSEELGLGCSRLRSDDGLFVPPPVPLGVNLIPLHEEVLVPVQQLVGFTEKVTLTVDQKCFAPVDGILAERTTTIRPNCLQTSRRHRLRP